VRLVNQSLVIDMLSPLSIDFRPDAFAVPLSGKQRADFLASGITGFHNSVGLRGPTAHDDALRFMAGWSSFTARNSDLFTQAVSVADLDRAKRSGKIAVIMGLQNADHFRTAEDVKLFHGLGQRCAQLTYNSQNFLGSGSTERVDGGLSDYGASIISAMETAGMLVDVSHCGDTTTLQAIEAARGPIAITHANCRALNPGHPRLKTDEAIRKLAAKGGVMGITGVRNFVSAQEPTTIETLVDHIDHVVKLVGIEHVGIGSDSDLNGYDDLPKAQRDLLAAQYKNSYGFREKQDTDGFDHPRKMFDLGEVLIRRGYSDENIGLILGGNFRRLLMSVWRG
jgi:membrane dipeptidase